MSFEHGLRWRLALGALVAGCGGQATPVQPAAPAQSGRARLTAEQCEAGGGSVVGDIGDGATQRPGYVCPSGAAPSGDIAQSPGGPIAVEGAVCCPK
jgi:hypothetical protein